MSCHVEVVALSPRHLPAAARLHAEALPHGFYARLGPPFLEEYWRAYLVEPHAVALAAVAGLPEGEELVGALIGTVDNRRFVRRAVRRHGPRLAVRAAVAFARRPRVLLWFVRTRLGPYLRRVLRILRPSAGEDGTAIARDVAVLMHMAVADEARGQGIGADLVRSFERSVRVRGVSEARLVTLAGDAGATGFYERLGWQPIGRRRRDDRDLTVMRRSWS